MTEIKGEDGSVIVTDLPADKVADLQPKAEPAAEPAPATEVAKPDAQPASPKTDEQPLPAKTETPEPASQDNRDDKGQFKPKPKPIASLLQKKHEAEVRAEKAEKALAEHLAKASPQQPQSAADVKELLEQLGTLDTEEARLAAIVEFTRKGVKTELPKEVQELVDAHKAQAQTAAEEKAFNDDVSALAKTFDSEPLNDPKVKEKLQELAYSEEKAPDGQPFFQKPLHELYFKYVKPEIEPAKPSAESGRGGAGPTTGVVDYAEIHGDDAKLDEFAKTATKEQWSAYTKWRDSVQGDVPIIRKQ
jgi:hypothetical protein